MSYSTLHTVVFSPCGTTAQCVELLAKGMDARQIVRHDLTCPQGRAHKVAIPAGDLVIVAMPVYYGRIPAPFHEYLPLTGQQNPTIFVAVYGNRAFDDALLELTSLGKQANLQPLAAVACVAQHSLNGDMGKGRPDSADASELQHAGQKALNKLKSLKEGQALPPLRVPGTSPYKAYGSSPLVPHVEAEDCTHCGTCAEKCPMGIIQTEDFSVVDKEACLFCMACVHACPAKVRGLSPEESAQFAPRMAKLAAACQERKEVVVFL